jgi:hypothetical protein
MVFVGLCSASLVAGTTRKNSTFVLRAFHFNPSRSYSASKHFKANQLHKSRSIQSQFSLNLVIVQDDEFEITISRLDEQPTK